MTVGEVTSVSKTGFFVNISGMTEFGIINNSFTGDDKPIVGDVVTLEKREDKFIILNIKPRRTWIARYDNYREQYQYFAANVNVAFIVTSANKEFSVNRIKRFLALTEGQNIMTVAVVTKTDKHNSGYAAAELNKIGVEFIEINATDIKDVKKLYNFWAEGETAILLGSSGVGKSTIINSLTGRSLKTREVMDERRHNKGRHTTSSRNLYYVDGGRKIIDTPGIRIVGTAGDQYARH